ncbi:MAG: GNAT family N-acetyltransferase [Lachnospiraceae bacterium]|nr:GNAT family N-acetyltransferase [Lachnospiraceae bacterium]
MYTYREITESDNVYAAALVRDNLDKLNLNIPGTAYYDEGLDHLSDQYGREDARYYVLTDDNGRVVGGIGFSKLSFMKDTAELQKLYLDDSVKGSGLGYEMISFIEDRMREAGFKHSYLETHDNLKAAVHIYEKSGYRSIEKPKEVLHSAMTLFFYKDL